MRALVCGVSGQDGAYLARLLLDKGYEVFGASRDAQIGGFANLVRLGIRDRVHLESMAVNDFRSVLNVLRRTDPQEVYYLAGQSSVGLSFEQPVETLESVAVGTINLLEAIRFLDRPIRFYSAGSSECFGDTEGRAANEQLPLAEHFGRPMRIDDRGRRGFGHDCRSGEKVAGASAPTTRSVT